VTSFSSEVRFPQLDYLTGTVPTRRDFACALYWLFSQCFAKFSTFMKSTTDFFAQKNFPKDILIPKFVIDTIN